MVKSEEDGKSILHEPAELPEDTNTLRIPRGLTTIDDDAPGAVFLVTRSGCDFGPKVPETCLSLLALELEQHKLNASGDSAALVNLLQYLPQSLLTRYPGAS